MPSIIEDFVELGKALDALSPSIRDKLRPIEEVPAVQEPPKANPVPRFPVPPAKASPPRKRSSSLIDDDDEIRFLRTPSDAEDDEFIRRIGEWLDRL